MFMETCLHHNIPHQELPLDRWICVMRYETARLQQDKGERLSVFITSLWGGNRQSESKKKNVFINLNILDRTAALFYTSHVCLLVQLIFLVDWIQDAPTSTCCGLQYEARRAVKPLNIFVQPRLIQWQIYFPDFLRAFFRNNKAQHAFAGQWKLSS